MVRPAGPTPRDLEDLAAAHPVHWVVRMRATLVGLLACTLAASACAPAEPAGDAPVVLEGEGKDDGLSGMLVYPFFWSTVHTPLASRFAYYQPADADLGTVRVMISEAHDDDSVGVSGTLLLARNVSDRFTVNIVPIQGTKVELRFLVYRYIGQRPYNPGDHAIPGYQTLAHPDDWQAVRCADNAVQVSAFSGITVDRLAGTLTTGAGTVFRLSDCGITSSDTPLGYFALPMQPAPAGSPDGAVIHAAEFVGSCAAAACWK